MNEAPPVLLIHDLSLDIQQKRILRGISIEIHRGETVALVGESGSGKSITAKAIMGFFPSATGAIYFKGSCLQEPYLLQRLRGKEIGLICQNPMTSLNPVLSIGKQLMEGMIFHLMLSHKEAWEQAVFFLNLVGIANPEAKMRQYPDQLSGGMRQRVVIAIALSCNPSLLIADEPTTSLDVTTQAQILDFLKKIQQKNSMGILLISHDLAVVAGLAHRIYIMKDGQIIEHGTPEDIFYHSQDPYTKELCAPY